MISVYPPLILKHICIHQSEHNFIFPGNIAMLRACAQIGRFFCILYRSIIVMPGVIAHVATGERCRYQETERDKPVTSATALSPALERRGAKSGYTERKSRQNK